MRVQIERDPVNVLIGGASVEVQPLALGFQRRLKERGIVCPAAPKTVARDSAGRALRDGRGEPVLLADESAATYQAAVERYHERVAVLMVAEGLSDDDCFETPCPTGDEGWDVYADSVVEEMSAAGWTTGDLVRLCDAVCRVSRLTESDVSEAASDFFLTADGARSSPA